MTVEEIEIIVTAKVEEALKEFEKMLPAIKEKMKQVQEAFSKVDTKTMTSKLHQAVNFMKKKMQDLKKSSENNEISIKVNNKDAQKQISQIEKEIDSLQKKITSRQLKLDITNNALDKIRNDTNQSVIKEIPEAGNKQIKQETYQKLDNNVNYQSLVKQSDKLNSEIEKYNELLSSAKFKMAELGQQTSQTSTTQNKLSSFFGALKPVISKVTKECQKISKSFCNLINPLNYIKKIVGGISNKLKGTGTTVKQGIGHILKYAMTLFSLRSVYSVLSSCAQSWLSSQNAGAKQLSANIEYMKNSLGSALAPAITYITNLVYNMMKAIQSVIYALFRVNIFAKASASSYASMAGSAKKAKEESKQLAGVHDEINNVQSNDSSDSGSGGSSSPSFDLSGIENQMSPLAQKLYDFFKPLVDSWNKYGPALVEQIKTTAGQVTTLISAVWGSFEKIITNGTVYTSLELILAIIGNIAEAFANAWNYNGNGDAIVQNLANAFNNLLTAINNVVQSEGFQNWLNNCSDKFRVISEKLSEIDWQPLVDALSNIGQNIGTLALDILSGLVDIFKWLAENPGVAEIILAIAIAIGTVSTIISILVPILTAFTAISTALHISLLPLIVIILSIIAVIALIVVAIMNWDSIIRALKVTWDWIKQKAIEIWNAIADFFKNLWQGICDTVKSVWNVIKEFLSNLWNGILNIVKTVFNAVATFFSNIWNGIKNVVSTVWNAITGTISNVINGIKNTISNVLNTIKNIWNNIWTGLKTTVTNIFNGIWNTIKNIINSILGGIEGMANGVVNGINTVVKALNKLKFDIPDWIPGLGGKTFGFNIGMIPRVSIPRLAKGGVLTEATTVLAGEYSGAKTNPEIITPQNIMRDTFEDVLSNYSGNNDDRPIYLTVNVGNKKLGQILLEDLRDRTRRTGKDIEALVGG
ncbi:phage-related protein-like protein [Clostridium sp. CAG:575]|nr:phage-related protein-like protein [Clostridium sp. CAG:575]